MVTTSLHVLWNYIFVVMMDLELVGTAIANIITAVLNLVAIVIFITYFMPEFREAWFLPTKDSLRQLGEYLNVAIPAMLLICLEWWVFEI